ncbi:hypothetical protein Droror1_Dr00008360, partial [Drosera rotundifolia]
MSAEPKVEKQDSITDIATNQVINEILANVQEENQEGAEIMESTPTVEHDAETDSTLVGELAIMMETKVGKQDSIAETATDKVIDENLVSIEEQVKEKTLESTPQSPVR